MRLDELIKLVYSEFENCKVSLLNFAFETSELTGRDPEQGFDEAHSSAQSKVLIQSSKLLFYEELPAVVIDFKNSHFYRSPNFPLF